MHAVLEAPSTERLTAGQAARMLGPDWTGEEVIAAASRRGGPTLLPNGTSFDLAAFRAWAIDAGHIVLITLHDAAAAVHRPVSEIETRVALRPPGRQHARHPFPPLSPESTPDEPLLDEAAFLRWAIYTEGWINPDGVVMYDYDDAADLLGLAPATVKRIYFDRNVLEKELKAKGRKMPPDAFPAAAWKRGRRPGVSPLFARPALVEYGRWKGKVALE